VIDPEGGGRPYDRFRDRICSHPQTSALLIAFGGPRARRWEPKYLNSLRLAFREGARALRPCPGRGRRSARQGRAIVVEGYMDVVGSRSTGIEPRRRDARNGPLRPATCKAPAPDRPRWFFCFDGDAAGRRRRGNAARGEPSLSGGQQDGAIFLFSSSRARTRTASCGRKARGLEKEACESRPLSEVPSEELKGRNGPRHGRGAAPGLAHEAKPLLQKVSAPALRLQLLKAFCRSGRYDLRGGGAAHRDPHPRGYGSKPAPHQGAERGAQLRSENPTHAASVLAFQAGFTPGNFPAELLIMIPSRGVRS